jgi:hypothetical protein
MMGSGGQQPRFQSSSQNPPADAVVNLPQHCTIEFLVSMLKLKGPGRQRNERELINLLTQLSKQYPHLAPAVLLLSLMEDFKEANPDDGRGKLVKASTWNNNNCRYYISERGEKFHCGENVYKYALFRAYSEGRPGTCYLNYAESLAESNSLKACLERLSDARYHRFDSCDDKIDVFSLRDPTNSHSMMYRLKNGHLVKISWNNLSGLEVHHVEGNPYMYGGEGGICAHLRKLLIQDAIANGMMRDPSNPSPPMVRIHAFSLMSTYVFVSSYHTSVYLCLFCLFSYVFVSHL